ncbi:MAG: exodeoxyribonuclease III [Bacteroidota bacterium]
MRVVSYNLNGIRAAIRKGFVDWLAEHKPDFVGIQETKAWPEQVDMADIEALGYHANWHSATSKKGYSGVLSLSLQKPDEVVIGCGIEDYDREGRIIRTDFGDLSIFNCYFPSGTTGDVRQAFKMEFLADFESFILDFRRWSASTGGATSRVLSDGKQAGSAPPRQLIVLGDYNIAHTPIDIHDPVRNKKTSGFLPEERAWLDKWYGELAFTDAFRQVHPEKVEYSWWSMRGQARANNKGWRIDHVAVTEGLADKITDVNHYRDDQHSDHCAVVVDMDMK